jgi:hypothetical protein
MPTTKIDNITEALAAFQQLNIDERLATLASVYTNLIDEINSDEIEALPTEKAENLVAQIQSLSDEEQLFALRDLLPATRNDQDEVMLDPHPSKAMVELARGGTKIPTGEYGAMSTEGKLAFWYLLAERLGSTIIPIPNDYHPSEEAITLLNFLDSLDTDDLVAFVQRVM